MQPWTSAAAILIHNAVQNIKPSSLFFRKIADEAAKSMKMHVMHAFTSLVIIF